MLKYGSHGSKSLAEVFACLEVPVVFYKIQFQQILTGHPFLRVFPQDFPDECLKLYRNCFIGGKLYLIRDLSN